MCRSRGAGWIRQRGASASQDCSAESQQPRAATQAARRRRLRVPLHYRRQSAASSSAASSPQTELSLTSRHTLCSAASREADCAHCSLTQTTAPTSLRRASSLFRRLARLVTIAKGFGDVYLLSFFFFRSPSRTRGVTQTLQSNAPASRSPCCSHRKKARQSGSLL